MHATTIASQLIIRWYTIFHPQFKNAFYFKNSEIFSNELQKKLGQVFSLNKDCRPDHTKTTDLVTISKIMGHLGQKTLFSNYAHCFHLILDYVIKHIDKQLDAPDDYYY